MGWNLQTWLWGTVIVCGISVWISNLNLNIENRKIQINDPPLEFDVIGFKDKVHRHHELRRASGFLALFCVLTVLLFT